MEDKAKDIWSKAKGFAGGLSKTVKIAAGAVLVAVLVAVAVVVSINSNTEYEVLFTGLNTEDLRSIQSYLGEAGLTDYTIQGTDTIKVPKGKGDQLKAQLISQGYPKTGTDYSLYMQNISALSTESDRAQLVLYELQNSLGGIIRYFEGVQDAVVRITPSQDRRYVLGQDDALEAKASVVVTMKDEQTLSESLVESIRNTVSHSVKGLDVEEVAISDSQGLDSLPEHLRELARLRLDNPEMTLRELGERLGVSRSGVNHRLQKLLAMGEALLEEKGVEGFM